MFFPNKTRQREVIQQDAKDKGVEWVTDTEVIWITELRDQTKTLISQYSTLYKADFCIQTDTLR